jgi:hypothetical protein
LIGVLRSRYKGVTGIAVGGEEQQDMGLVGLWLVAGTMLLSAVLFTWVTIATRPRAGVLATHRRIEPHEELVRRACADLDAEYRDLLNT